MYFYVFMYDKTGIYYQYIRRKYEKSMVLEKYTSEEKETVDNIEKALNEGLVLILKN